MRVPFTLRIDHPKSAHGSPPGVYRETEDGWEWVSSRIDIASGYGTPVRAARTGIVRFVGWLHGYGRIIIVDHGQGLETSYSHLSQILVWRGEGVEMGQILGRIGSTGWSTGPHLLFEVRRKGVPIDPFVFLNETRRLSPAAAPAAAPAPAPAPASEHRSAPSTAAP